MKDSQNDIIDNSNLPQEKKNWLSPNIETWSTENLENPLGLLGIDFGSNAYIN